jgi:two-component system response regulator NreC
MNPAPIRVLLVDDHQMLRDGLRILISGEEDMAVVGEAETAEQALSLCETLQPDIIVMDLGLPGMSGLKAIREVHQMDLNCKVVVLSMHDDREVVTQAVKAGCEGYVPKSTAHTSLLEAIRVVHSGGTYLHPTAASAVVEALTRKQRHSLRIQALSNRELDVVRYTALGFTSREIGEKLALSPKTVDTYRQRAMIKLDLEQRSELVQFVLQSDILDDFPNPS